MEPSVMVHKVNQIAAFFAAYPHDEAVAGISDHLLKFWEPRMRAQLIAHASTGAEGLSDLAKEAIAKIVTPA